MILIIIILRKIYGTRQNKRTVVHCKLCPKVLKYSGNTSNMRFHLELSHRAQFLVLQQSDKEKKKTCFN